MCLYHCFGNGQADPISAILRIPGLVSTIKTVKRVRQLFLRDGRQGHIGHREPQVPPLPVHSQIAREIDYFRSCYQDLRPAVYLSYEREAYYALDGSDFRVTFDGNIFYRQDR